MFMSLLAFMLHRAFLFGKLKNIFKQSEEREEFFGRDFYDFMGNFGSYDVDWNEEIKKGCNLIIKIWSMRMSLCFSKTQ